LLFDDFRAIQLAMQGEMTKTGKLGPGDYSLESMGDSDAENRAPAAPVSLSRRPALASCQALDREEEILEFGMFASVFRKSSQLGKRISD
jgi:hypothetical protein